MRNGMLLFLFLALCLLCAEALALPDGTYAPQAFSFSGGTGKVTLSCPEVTVQGGRAEAKIVFSSPNYTEARIGEARFSGRQEGDATVFEVPVPLNETFSLLATTKAMSRPHEIEYRLFVSLEEAPVSGLVPAGKMDLDYAQGFDVDRYEGGYSLIRVDGGERYLVVPEQGEVPPGLDPAVTVIRKPVRGVYLAATSAMSLVDALGALDRIRLSGTRQDGWYVDSAAQAMAQGKILFAGKYSEPDYELLVKEECGLAVESMMILHTPKVRELLELLGIPVFIDRSSSEPHPLGRLEWIRLYGLLLDREEEADRVMQAQAAALLDLPETEGARKRAAIFALRPDGTLTVRGSRDYLVRCLELAGGQYVFEDMQGQETNASVNITMEAFYEAAREADCLIVNASIEEPFEKISELTRAQPLFSEFRAVKEGNVYCTDRALYQAANGIGTFIGDVRLALAGMDGQVFLHRLEGEE